MEIFLLVGIVIEMLIRGIGGKRINNNTKEALATSYNHCKEQ